MSDAKNKLLTEMEACLVGLVSSQDMSVMMNALTKALANYDVSEMSREIVPYESVNEKLLKQYVACLYVDGKSTRTAYQYKRTCLRLAEAIGKPFPEIGVYELRYYLACEKERGVSARSVENMRANISAFFQWMTREGIITKNPCDLIKPIKYPDVVRKPFSDVEIDSLRSACRTPKERALIEFLLATGVRVSELSGIRKDDIDPQSLAVHVRHGKGSKERVTYITAVAMKHLLVYWHDRKKDGEAAFYNNQGNAINPGGIRFILHGIADRAKVMDVHPHRFRRTFASGLAARGMEVQSIQKLLGHSSIATTMEYVFTSDEKISASYKQYIA